MLPTLIPGTLTIASAYPDPPFVIMQDGTATGFEIELMRSVCQELGLTLRPVGYDGDDFNGIFNGLDQPSCDAVISGTTITPERASRVLFSRPYLTFQQGVAINRRLSPHVAAISDLRGLTAGIQSGNTSDAVAKRLLAEGHIKDIRYYPYRSIGAALDDLEAGRIGLIIKLFPVLSSLVAERADLAVVMQVPTHEQIGIAYNKNRADLCNAVDAAIQTLRQNGTFALLQSKWFGSAAATV
jgi:ABC-type amino acid transport substrate-binding protein